MGFLRTCWESIRFTSVVSGMWINCCIYKCTKRASQRNEEDINGKCVVMTGGSTGIGKEAAKEFAKRGATVVIGDVDVEIGKKTVEEIQRDTGNMNVTILKLDLSDMDSVEQFAQKVSVDYPKIKILLNNAGIGVSDKKNIKTKDGFNIHVAVNFMGHFLLTNLLMDNLKAEKNPRIVITSSSLQLLSNLKLDDLNMDNIPFGFQNFLPYTNTKFMLALFTKDLEKQNFVKAYALCPGSVNTNILKQVPAAMKYNLEVPKIFSFTANEAASEFIMFCSLEKSIENESGKVYRYRKLLDKANKRLDSDLARRLCEKSATLVKLNERLARIKSNIPKQ